MSTIIIFNFMSELGKIVLYLCLAIPVLSFLFCSIFGGNIGGSFDRGEYKLWIKENIQGAIFMSLLLYTLINTAAIFVFGEIFLSIMVYFILFTAMFLWDKHQKKG